MEVMKVKRHRASSAKWSKRDNLIVSLLHAFKNYDRNLATGLLLILVELRHHFGLRVEESVALLTFDLSRLGLELLAPDLDRHLGMREEVVVPARIFRRTTLRRNDDVAVAVLAVNQRLRIDPPALGALVRDNYHRRSGQQLFPRTLCELTTEVAAIAPKLIDHFLVEFGHRARHVFPLFIATREFKRLAHFSSRTRLIIVRSPHAFAFHFSWRARSIR
jgi:hypothetical protein